VTDYRSIAEKLAADIASGRLRPGERLPPQREFADQQGIAVSTASRVYTELARRGLIIGEVGRGSYVRASRAAPGPALTEPANAPADLQLNFPILPQQSVELGRCLEDLLRPEELDQASRPIGASATPAARDIAARFLARCDWAPDPASTLFTGNGRQAIAATLAALAPVGERVGVEAMTYPVIKGIASRLGITLVPLALDDHGLRPDALVQANRATPLRAVYLQPTLHNPLGTTMPAERRGELAEIIKSTGLLAVEDAIYSFLADEERPLAAFAPDHTILVDSLSKRLAPGLTLGFIASPPHLTDKIANGVRSGGWAAAGFPLAAGLRWIANGTAERIAALKRADASARQSTARELLHGLTLRSDPRAYHLWLELPEKWRAEEFLAAAARQGIAITAASAFTISVGYAPNAVRLALASPPVDVLKSALLALGRLVLSDPENSDIE
jgi:DNA-binding transcriptional MocR family regulator